jgi:hypothetical protein
MATAREKVISEAIRLLEENSSGIRYQDLANRIKSKLPDIPENTIIGNIWDLDKREKDKVVKPARGLFLHKKYGSEVPPEAPEIKEETIKEERFYGPFAEWLTHDLEEATKAIPLGESYFGAKWGTPDVYGILEPRRTDVFRPPMEIVSAEIKLDTQGLVTAFGQACAYRIFSHRSYLVVPRQSSESDLSRLEALCEICGIGLVLFDKENPEKPDFTIRVRAAKHEPDWFYANETLKNEHIERHLLS